MIFSIEEAVKILKRGRRDDLPNAFTYQSLLRVFTESKDASELTNEDGYRLFLNRFDITDPKKKNRILQSMSFPLASVDLTKSASKEVNKIWEANNKFFDINSDNAAIISRVSELVEESNPYEFIKEHAQHVLTSAPCSIVCLEYSVEGDEPEFKIIPLESVVNLQINGSEIEWIIFKGKNDTYYFYDKKYRRVFDNKYNLINEVEMPYERNPARFFLDERLNSSNEIKREGIFSDVLGSISDFEMFEISHRYTEMYGAFPVIQKPESECGVVACTNGVITEINDEGVELSYSCQSCANKSDILPGTTVEIPANLTTEDQSPADVFKFIDPDVKGLTYIKERQIERRDNIYYTSVGVSKLFQNQAVNEKQVQGNFESRTTILVGIKKQLEELYKWMVQSLAVDYFGKPVDVSANFGTEFYLNSESELLDLMKFAKESGLPESEIENIYSQIIGTKYKGNESKISRAKLLNELNPLPFDTFTTVKEKLSLGIISQSDAQIWSNFTQLIKRFEREQGDIIYFNSESPLQQRVSRIKEFLNQYINEVQSIRSSEE